MNTKGSVIYGWVAYTGAFLVGAGLGWYNFYYKPGGRKDREALVDSIREREAAREAEEEARIREERRLKKEQAALAAGGSTVSDPSTPTQ